MKNVYVVTVQKTHRSKPMFVGVTFKKKEAVMMYRKTEKTQPYDVTLWESSAQDLHTVSCHSWVHLNTMTKVMKS